MEIGNSIKDSIIHSVKGSVRYIVFKSIVISVSDSVRDSLYNLNWNSLDNMASTPSNNYSIYIWK